ncbi:hypothetical protein PHISCL_10618, partial [Aspergillus sclerotialis]
PVVSSGDAAALIKANTTPQSKKRKAAECVTDASSNGPVKSRKTSPPPAQRLSTPVTEHGSPSLKAMDSEDDFMSDPPSGDEIDFDEGTQDSDIASLADDFDQDQDGGFGYEKDILRTRENPTKSNTRF